MSQKIPRIKSNMLKNQPDQTTEILNRLIDKTNTMETSLVSGSSNKSDYKLPVATKTRLGGVKVGTGLVINETTGVLDATGVESLSYNVLTSKPQINSVTLQSNKTLEDLNVTRLTNTEIEDIINSVV